MNMDELSNNITFEEAKKIMDTEKEYIILDVREDEEYSTGHAKGAVLFPLGTINPKTVGEVIPSKSIPVLVYCRTGRRSRMAAQRLKKLGYTRVYDLGSLVGWPYGITTE